MKLILLTSPDFFVEEDKILTSLFEEGLDQLHLRKPASEPVYCERLLTLIPEEFHNRIITHDHFYLYEEFGLLGIHLTPRNSQVPQHYKGLVTRTCYDLESLPEAKQASAYVCLGRTLDSISEPQKTAHYPTDTLREAARQGIIDRKVMAQGGVTLENIPLMRELGFGGVVVRGDLWKRFNIHSGADFKPLIAHFRNLRKATV